MNKKLFLLGGHDLEMLEIKSILDKNKLNYIDKNLSWGAKLSDYKNELNFDGIIYGIELELNIDMPKNYIEIDHHGINSHKVSSIEQIADILNIKLSREQQLIAANDRSYIKGMIKLNASEEEVKSIRRKDRISRGVTQKDEELALQSIEKSNNKNIIFSYTNKFSAVSDMIYDYVNNYIIYNELTVSFYGYKIKDVIIFLESYNIKEKDYYYGGGDFGFVGLKIDILDFINIKKLVKEFEVMQKEKNIYSSHIFMFPFIFNIKDKKTIHKDWRFKPHENNYNEMVYFHDFFQSSMFTDNENNNSAFYTNDNYKDSKFTLCKSKEYNLNVESVNLRIFETGVGILSFHMNNTIHKDIKDILEINEFARRVYPEYLDEKLECCLVPTSIQLGDIKENFKYNEKPKKIELSKIIKSLIPTEHITPAIDDRMFVISFYKNSEFANDLKQDYKQNDKWYEYVFIDANGKTVQNYDMQNSLITNATYPRWQGSGTMYGISKYSFVCLSSDDFALAHMNSIYFQMFSLLLMVRATILKFSHKTSIIADEIGKKDISGEVDELYEKYIKFVNNFYFREITAKDQGLELYEKALGVLNIERDIKDLDSEIEELHTYIKLKAEEKNSDQMNKINIIVFLFVPISFVTGFFGMNVGTSSNFSVSIVTPISILTILVSCYFIFKSKKGNL